MQDARPRVDRERASEATSRTRTGDLSFTKASLYQLSYGGMIRTRVPLLADPRSGENGNRRRPK